MTRKCFRIGLLLTLLLSGMNVYSAYCWNKGPAIFNFGTITAGVKAQTSTSLEFECNNYTPAPKYVRLCLKLTDVSQPVMNTNPASFPLKYNIYALENITTDIGQASSSYAMKMIFLGASQHNLTGNFDLTGVVASGQNGFTGGEYFDYGINASITYAESDSAESLPVCQNIVTPLLLSRISASAKVKNGCELQSAGSLNFGTRTPANGSGVSANATTAIHIRCPVNSSFSVSLGKGLYSDNNSRRMCYAASCMQYFLYQDPGMRIPWEDDISQPFTYFSGNSQSIPVYGAMTSQHWPASGSYHDSVVVTLSF